MTGNATSILPQVKSLLVKRLAQNRDLRDAKVDVRYAKPTDPKREAITFGAAVIDQTAGPMRMGRQKRDEEVALAMFINAARAGQGGETAERRAFEILAVVENILADDPTLSGALSELGVANGLTVRTVNAGDVEQNGEGWEGLLRVTLGYTARLD